MCNFIINIIVSVITGITASYAIWYWVTKCLVPKLNFSGFISKLKTDENASGFKYRFKFENAGRRNIIDLEVIVRFRIRGLHNDLPLNWEVIYLPTSSLQYNKVAIVRPLKSNNLRPILEIKPYECPYFKSKIFGDEIRLKAESGQLTLDDIFNIDSESNLQIFILGYDEFSGARKYFESKIYTKKDILLNHFNKNDVN